MITKPLSVVGFALKRAVTDESASAYSIFSDEGVDSLLPADVYNLFIVATIISLFVCTGIAVLSFRVLPNRRERETHQGVRIPLGKQQCTCFRRPRNRCRHLASVHARALDEVLGV